ncbi:hypothetical protein ACPX19_07230 [Winogradskyella sp. HB-48]|uniref:hypothetical protein n=1 Tax=Winogradskyella sp. HB-48 TaxID=3416808 RepID=UPI003CF17CA9
MKPIKLFRLLIIVLLICNFSCQKDDGLSGNNNPQENIPDTFSEYFGNEISRDFLGTVIDKNHNPIEGVTITIGNETALTDSNGIFIIRDANVNERFGYVKAEKAGYIHASRSVVPSNGTNKITIMMLEETVVGTVSSGSPSTVTIDGGSSVSFDGNFIKEDGSAYEGSVDVIMHHLDPTDEDMSMQMPGMLYAENENGAERMLQTLGMLAVELRGSGGEDLNLAEGSTSEIKIPVDVSLMNIAPATIPLWYFDETTGYWKEEGVATLQGNMYVGTVSHFSFWNCDIPAEAITLCVTATTDDNIPLANMTVSITSMTFGTTYGYTNENGEVCGYVPSNESLILDVYSYDICGDSPLYTETVGPFTVDSSLTVIVPDNPDIIQETVVGTFNTCDGNAVTDGYVQLTYGDQTFTSVVNDGVFEINMFRCEADNTFIIKGSDYINLEITDSISYTFTTPITDIGTIAACNEVTEFIQYTIDGEDSIFIFENITATRYAVSTNGAPLSQILSIYANTNNPDCFNLYGTLNDLNYLGTYNSIDPSYETLGFFINGCPDMSYSNHSIVFNLTALGEAYEYIDLNFSGSYEDLNGNPHTINGIVHVLRDN